MPKITIPPTPFAKRVRALRQRLGLSQGEFAALLGYQRKATISDLESGRQRPTPQTESALTNLETIADLDPSRFARP